MTSIINGNIDKISCLLQRELDRFPHIQLCKRSIFEVNDEILNNFNLVC